jgi:hypothetical protein
MAAVRAIVALSERFDSFVARDNGAQGLGRVNSREARPIVRNDP